jgi:tetrahydromethanopterin S-methyltransferase subunit F
MFVLAACLLSPVQAEQASVTAPDRFAVQLPDVDQEALVEELVKLRSQLIQRQQKLEQLVADKKLDGGDAIITAIVPGGLLYAGYKKARYLQAKHELARVSTAIEEYSSDLLVMEIRAAPVTVAQLP